MYVIVTEGGDQPVAASVPYYIETLSMSPSIVTVKGPWLVLTTTASRATGFLGRWDFFLVPTAPAHTR